MKGHAKFQPLQTEYSAMLFLKKRANFRTKFKHIEYRYFKQHLLRSMKTYLKPYERRSKLSHLQNTSKIQNDYFSSSNLYFSDIWPLTDTSQTQTANANTNSDTNLTSIIMDTYFYICSVKCHPGKLGKCLF